MFFELYSRLRLQSSSAFMMHCFFRRCLFLSAFCFCYHISYTQNPTFDSLEIVYTSQRNPEQQLDILEQMVDIAFRSDFNQALIYTKRGIQLTKNLEGNLLLEVADNGVGKSDITKGTGFGSQLISLLTRQLNGSMREEILNGTKILFQFNLNQSYGN